MTTLIEEDRFRYSDTEHIYAGIPEFSLIPPNDILVAYIGNSCVGTIANKFRSKRFKRCSCIIGESPNRKYFGFSHIVPGQELLDEDYEILSPLIGGVACHIVGSESTPKSKFINSLSHDMGISIEQVIPVETRGEYEYKGFFDVAWRPASNKILVARPSFLDIIPYTPFRHK